MNFVAASCAGFSQPRNVQDYITQYRQQKYKQLTNESIDDTPTNFFEVVVFDTDDNIFKNLHYDRNLFLLQDMQPKIVRQHKLLLETDEEPPLMSRNSRLSCTTDMKVIKVF